MTTTLTISPEQERMVRALGAGILIFTVAAAAIGTMASGWRFMLGALAGGGLMWANFRLFVRLIRGMLTTAVSGQGSAKWYAIKLALVELAMLLMVSGVVALDVVNVVGFLVGLLSLIGSIAGVGLAWLLRDWYLGRRPEAAEN